MITASLRPMYEVLTGWASFANAQTNGYTGPFNSGRYVFIFDFDNLLIASYYDYDKADFEEIDGITSMCQDEMLFFDLADILSATEHHDDDDDA